MLANLVRGAALDVDAGALVPLCTVLMATLAGVYCVTLCSAFHLSEFVGGILFSFWFVYFAYNLLHEYGIVDL